MPLIVTVTLWHFNLFIALNEVCSNDLALAVSRFCTDVSVSDNG